MEFGAAPAKTYWGAGLSMWKCRFKTSTKTNLVIHERLEHGPCSRQEFPCDQCDYTTARNYHLNAHKRKHSAARPFSCKQCEKTFKHKYQLSIHYRFHSGEMPFRCEQCDKSFLAKQLLKNHEKSVSHRYKQELESNLEQSGLPHY